MAMAETRSLPAASTVLGQLRNSHVICHTSLEGCLGLTVKEHVPQNNMLTHTNGWCPPILITQQFCWIIICQMDHRMSVGSSYVSWIIICQLDHHMPDGSSYVSWIIICQMDHRICQLDHHMPAGSSYASWLIFTRHNVIVTHTTKASSSVTITALFQWLNSNYYSLYHHVGSVWNGVSMQAYNQLYGFVNIKGCPGEVIWGWVSGMNTWVDVCECQAWLLLGACAERYSLQQCVVWLQNMRILELIWKSGTHSTVHFPPHCRFQL